MWIEGPECVDVSKKVWVEWEVRQIDQSVEPKLLIWQRHLIKWSRERFGNNPVEIRKEKQRLRRLGQTDSNVQTQREDERLKDQITTLWKR